MVVARPFEPSSADFDPYSCTAPIVPTKVLTDPEELDRQLLQNGYATAFFKYTETSEENQENFQANAVEDYIQVEAINSINIVNGIESDANPGNSINLSTPENTQVIVTPVETECSEDSEPETEKFSVALNKDEQGLGNVRLENYLLSCELFFLCRYNSSWLCL